MEREEWTEPNRECYYMAQIAASLKAIMGMFDKNPKAVHLQDCILPFTAQKELQDEEDEWEGLEEEAVQQPRIETVQSSQRRRKVKDIVPSKAAMKDPHWKRVNENAKAVWGARLHKEIK